VVLFSPYDVDVDGGGDRCRVRAWKHVEFDGEVELNCRYYCDDPFAGAGAAVAKSWCDDDFDDLCCRDDAVAFGDKLLASCCDERYR